MIFAYLNLKGGYAMNVVMPLPKIVQVFNEEKLLMEISCCDEELALKMYDFLVIPPEESLSEKDDNGYCFRKDQRML